MQRYFKNPINIIFLLFMIYNAITNGRFNNPLDWLINTLYLIPGIVIGITVHEFAHAYSAYKLGDMTPKAQKRVTLNPLAHIDPVGIIALIFVGFGWGKPVQVNPYAFQKRRRLCNLITDVAGVVTNFIVAFLATGLLRLMYEINANQIIITIVAYLIQMNLVLMIFNLIPVPPLDGFGIITEIFDLRKYSWYQTVYNYGSIILMLLVISRLVGFILNPVLSAIYDLFFAIWF